jgi:L-alanine-DL-glutamate epimerase-like enolase superfamily enzyme
MSPDTTTGDGDSPRGERSNGALELMGTPVEQVTCAVFTVPTDKPEADGTLSWDHTTLVLACASAGGREGIGWTYATSACKALIDEVLSGSVTGTDVGDVPRALDAMVKACRNFGRPGIASCAISAVETALWDLKARLLDLPLSTVLGRVRDEVPIYGSGGFTTYDEADTRAQLAQWVGEWSIPRVKIKIGESWGTREDRDLSRVGLVRSVVGPDVEVYVDANGGYTRKQAIRVGHEMWHESGVTWFEEPVSSDDLEGLREVRDQIVVDVAAGEYGYDLVYFGRMVEAEAVDCLQVDVTRCGGYLEWQRAAAVAAAHGLQVSGHCAPNLHAHVAVGVQNLRHLEYFHDHHRIEHLLFDGVLDPKGGALVPDTGSPGNGMTLKARDAEKYRSG